MEKALSLAVQTRDLKESVRTLRSGGTVPAVIYGNKTANTAVKCSDKDFIAVFLKAGENTLVEVDLDGKKIPCLIHAVSFDPVSSKCDHIDFYAVDMTKKVTTHVPVIVKGESPAVKAQGGVLVTVHSQLEVTCLPKDLPQNFTVDISTLENFRDSILVGMLKVPTGVVIKTSPDTVIVTVQEPRKEEVIAPVAGAAVPGAEGVPAEGAAAPGAEGAAAAPAAGTPATAAKPGEKAPAAGKEKGKK
ncbi:MAG: 50S ribosomal protein L25 [Candidatus Peribacteraceae bacterium]|nr:50S ribosomal protein L25 [Candidatus Peribacteraceae bacterium]